MKRKFRLKRNEEFQRIISRHKSISNEQLVMHYEENAMEHIQVGFSISKKLGNAVFRNKVKRQLRELARKHLDLNIKYNIIFIARKKFADNPEFSFREAAFIDIIKNFNAKIKKG